MFGTATQNLQIESFLNQSCDFIRFYIRIINPQVVIKRNLAFITNTPMVFVIMDQTLIGSLYLSFGRFVF